VALGFEVRREERNNFLLKKEFEYINTCYLEIEFRPFPRRKKLFISKGIQRNY
jgi:hypothetical protein